MDAYWVAHLWLRTFLCQAYESIFFTFIWQFSTPILPKCSWNWIFAWIMPILSRICEWPFPSNLFLFISKKKLKSCRKKKNIFLDFISGNFLLQYWSTNYTHYSFLIGIFKDCLINYFAGEICVLVDMSWRKSPKTIGNSYICLRIIYFEYERVLLWITPITKVKKIEDIGRKFNMFSESLYSFGKAIDLVELYMFFL